MPARALWLATLSILAGCRQAAELPDGPPRAEFKVVRQDLGDIPIAPKGRIIEFSVVNRGLSGLRLIRLVQSCSCVDATVTQSILKPGDDGIVAVAIAPRRAEEKSATVEVHSNDPLQPVIRLRVSWRAHAPIEIEPLEIDFGQVRPGKTVERTAFVRRHGTAGEKCALTKVGVSPGGRVTLSQDGDRLTLLLAAGSSPGPQHGELTLRLEGCWRDRLSIPLRWHVAEIIEVEPRELLAGSGAPGERVVGRVIVSAEPGRRLEIDAVHWEGSPGGTAVTRKRLTDDRALVEVAWTLPAAAGTHSGELVIACSAPEARTFRVPVAAYVLNESIAERGED